MPDGLSTWKLNDQGSRKKNGKHFCNLGVEKNFLSMIKFRRHKEETDKFGSKNERFLHDRKHYK